MQKGLSQKAFCAFSELNPVQYNRYESKGIIPSAETLAKPADALEVSVDYLWKEIKKMLLLLTLRTKISLNCFQK
jgi:transcriptional regulator with XRE-family HTH domain